MKTLWKLGGAVCGEPHVLDALASRYLARKPSWVLMHGAGPQLDSALHDLEGEPRKIQGLRVTSRAGASVVATVMDAVGSRLTDLLRERGVPAVHIPAATQWMAGVKKSIPEGDLGRVGTPMAVDAVPILRLAAEGFVPVVSPVAFDDSGPLNVNADEAAMAVARALRVDRLCLTTDVAHVRSRQGPVHVLSRADATRLVAAGEIQGGMIPKVENALAAIEGGVGDVLIGDVASIIEGKATRIVRLELEATA